MVDTGPVLGDFQARLRREFDGLIDETYLKVTDRLLECGSDWYRYVDRPLCLWHRDFRADNLLLEVHGNARDLAVIDWQTVAVGPGICDISQFLGGSLSIEDRRKYEEELVREYHAALRERGVGISWNECWLQYRVGALYSMFTLMHAPVRVRRTTRGDQMWSEWARRHGAQVLDLESIGALRMVA